MRSDDLAGFLAGVAGVAFLAALVANTRRIDRGINQARRLHTRVRDDVAQRRFLPDLDKRPGSSSIPDAFLREFRD